MSEATVYRLSDEARDRKRQRDRERMRNRRLPDEYSCQKCGSKFFPKQRDRVKFCSRECAFASWKDDGHPSNKGIKKARAVADGCLSWLLAWRWCMCGEALHGTKRSTCTACQLRKQRENARHLPDTTNCDMCGVDVVRKDGESWITRGKRCGNCRAKVERAMDRRTRARRYMRQHNHPITKCETIISEEVFCSQLWKCGICDEPVDHRLSAPHPLAAEMDHVKPLSKGGTHTRDNVQCTHRICNASKCDGSQEDARRAIAIVKQMEGKTLVEIAQFVQWVDVPSVLEQYTPLHGGS